MVQTSKAAYQVIASGPVTKTEKNTIDFFHLIIPLAMPNDTNDTNDTNKKTPEANISNPETSPVIAAEAGKEEEVKEFLAAGAGVGDKNAQGTTAPMFAIEMEDIDIHKRLEDKNSAVNTKSTDKFSEWVSSLKNYPSLALAFFPTQPTELNEISDKNDFRDATMKSHSHITQPLSQPLSDLQFRTNIKPTAVWGPAMHKAADMNKKKTETYFSSKDMNLIESSAQGDYQSVDYLLESGVNRLAKNYLGKTALMMAAENGDVPMIIKFMPSYGRGVFDTTSIHEICNNGFTALMYAAKNGKAEAIRSLLDSKAGVDYSSPTGLTALFLAAQSGSENSVLCLLEAKLETTEKTRASTLEGEAVLMLAAKNGNTQIANTYMTWFLKNNPRPYEWNPGISTELNQKNIAIHEIRGRFNYRLSPDHESNLARTAVETMNAAPNKWNKDLPASYTNAPPGWLNANISLNNWKSTIYSLTASQDNAGLSPMILAALNGNAGAAQALFNQVNAGLSPLMQPGFAAKVHDFSKIMTLPAPISMGYFLENGRIPEAMVAEHGKSTLIYAVENENASLVNLLVESKADTNIKTKNGQALLMFATSNRDYNTVKALLGSEIEVDAMEDNGDTALIVAARMGETNIVQELLKKTASVDIKSFSTLTALMLAVKFNHQGAVDLLLAHPTQRDDINATNGSGENALMIAITNNSQPMVEALLDLDPDMSIKNMHGWSALTMAAMLGNLEIAKMLMEKGARLDRDEELSLKREIKDQSQLDEINQLLTDTKKSLAMPVVSDDSAEPSGKAENNAMSDYFQETQYLNDEYSGDFPVGDGPQCDVSGEENAEPAESFAIQPAAVIAMAQEDTSLL